MQVLDGPVVRWVYRVLQLDEVRSNRGINQSNPYACTDTLANSTSIPRPPAKRAVSLAFTASVTSDSPQCTPKPDVKTTEGRAYTHHWQKMLVRRHAIAIWLSARMCRGAASPFHGCCFGSLSGSFVYIVVPWQHLRRSPTAASSSSPLLRLCKTHLRNNGCR